ncbi:MAG: 6-phosphofructokinase [Elusimicrobiota bacterium]|jgi:6-phosphofructokinase 1|nr:6-phosphofructokinase [Elusimicrobiota bacterium]
MAKKIGVITSGGDAPGMNAAVRAIVRRGISLGYHMIGIRKGFKGLLEDDFTTLTSRSVSRTINFGGTILHTARCPETRTVSGMNRAVKTIKDLDLKGVVIIGGDGSLAAGNELVKHGIKVINIPASIDNDIFGTDETIGYDTALNTAVEAIDKIRDTATSHERIFVVEIMGREHGFLAMDVGIASGCEFIVVPEVKTNMNSMVNELKLGKERGKTSQIIAFAEGAGSSWEFAKKIEDMTGLEVRVSILGYIQRGGRPTARTRMLASQFGNLAVELLHAGKSNLLVILSNGKISSVPIAKIINREKKFDKEKYTLLKNLSI